MNVKQKNQPAAAAIRSLRERLRWTQQKFADELGCRVRTVANWEAGVAQPRAAIYGKMARLSPDGPLRKFFSERGETFTPQPSAQLGLDLQIDAIAARLEARIMGRVEQRLERAEQRLQELGGVTGQEDIRRPEIENAGITVRKGVTIYKARPVKHGAEAIEARFAKLEARLSKVESEQAIREGTAPARTKRFPSDSSRQRRTVGGGGIA